MSDEKNKIIILNGMEYEEYYYYGKKRYKKIEEIKRDEYGNEIDKKVKDDKRISTKLNYDYKEEGDLVIVKVILHPKKFNRYEFGKEENLIFPPQLNYLKRVLKFGRECFGNSLDVLVMGFNNSYVSIGMDDDSWLENYKDFTKGGIVDGDDIVNIRKNSDIKMDDEIHPTKLGMELRGYNLNNKIENIVKRISLFGRGSLIEGRVYCYKKGEVELWLKEIKRKNYIEEKPYKVKYKPGIKCEGFMYLDGVRRDNNNVITKYMKSSLNEDDWVDLGKCYKQYHHELDVISYVMIEDAVKRKEEEFKRGLKGKKYNPNIKKGLDKFFK